MFNKLYKNESGQSMVLVALMLTVLLGFGALAIDIGYMTYQKSSLQNAADAAALAGGVMVPKVYEHDYNEAYEDSIKQQMIDDYAKKNFNKISGGDLTPDDINILRVDKTVDITITQTVPKFLGGILSNDSKVMTVYAKALYESIWQGEALPFVNLADHYNDGEVSLWGKVAPGTFEVLDQDEFEDKGDAFILKDWTDGLKLGNGNLGQGGGGDTVLEICQPGNTVYAFSLSTEAVQRILDSNDGSHYYYRGVKLNDKPNILLEDLVLIQAKVLSTEKDANTVRIDLEVIQSFDVNNGELPDDYVSKYAKTASSLIE